MSDNRQSRPQARDALAPIERDGGGLSARQVVGIVLAVVTVVFILQNRQDTTISMVLFDVTASLWVITTVLLAIGILIGWLLSGRRASRRT